MTREIQHGHYTIKIMPAGSGFRARAFRGTRPIGETIAGATHEAAVSALKDLLHERATAYRAKRGPSGFPCADEVREAFSQLRMTKAQEAMLNAHLNAPDNILTATGLAKAAGHDKFTAANREYGKLAHALCDQLDWTPGQRRDGSYIWTYTLAEGADGQDHEDGAELNEHWRWKLRPEVVEALSGAR